MDVTFTEPELAALDAASRLPIEYPGWMLGLWSEHRRAQRANSR